MREFIKAILMSTIRQKKLSLKLNFENFEAPSLMMCTGFTTDVAWVNRKVYSITREPNQSSSRRVSSFKDSSALLNN